MPVVLDASAVLAHLLDEPGADRVAEALTHPTICVSVNWAEVLQRVLPHGVQPSEMSAYAEVHNLEITPLLQTDAERAATMWLPGEGLSLADRCCLAVTERLDATVLTADTAWASRPGVELIR